MKDYNKGGIIMRPQPKDWPKGYSWKEFTENEHILGEKSMDDFRKYEKRSVFETDSATIVKRIREYLEEFALKPASLESDYGKKYEQCAQFIAKRIIDNERYHKYLKHVGDGSYRTNRLLLNMDETRSSYFENYNNQRLCKRHSKEKHIPITEITEEDLIRLLDEVVEKDEVIWVQFGYPYED